MAATRMTGLLAQLIKEPVELGPNPRAPEVVARKMRSRHAASTVAPKLRGRYGCGETLAEPTSVAQSYR